MFKFYVSSKRDFYQSPWYTEFCLFQELAIINSTKRNSTVICKETCEFLSISAKVSVSKYLNSGQTKTYNHIKLYWRPLLKLIMTDGIKQRIWSDIALYLWHWVRDMYFILTPIVGAVSFILVNFLTYTCPTKLKCRQFVNTRTGLCSPYYSVAIGFFSYFSDILSIPC